MHPRELQYKRNAEVLGKYLPEASIPLIVRWIVEFDFKLKIKRERNTRLGDYTPPRKGANHLITINHNLNRYSFLITLVHEIAHLQTYNQFGNKVSPHGKEWKENFRLLMQPFLTTEIFPLEVFSALRSYLQNPSASSCSDYTLFKILKLHDANDGKIILDYLPHHSTFLYNGSRVFRKGEKLRKRYKCTELKSGAIYLFNALTEVELLDESGSGRSVETLFSSGVL